MDHPIATLTGNMTEAPNVKGSPALANSYLGVAQQLLPGIQLLANAKAEAAWSLALLVSHALECVLDAYLSKMGVPDKSLTNHLLRHKLIDLLNKAEDNNLSLPKPRPSWVNDLDALHRGPFALRYSKGLNMLVLPPSQPMARDIEELVVLVNESIASVTPKSRR
jgi:hypothetical protein